MGEIAAGKAQLPPSSARRHHFVPAFALARFAQPPGSRKGWMHQLDVRSGAPKRTRPDDVAFVKDLYTYEDHQGELSRTVESFFSIVEKHAAPALDNLCEDPGSISPQNRLTIAFFLAFQESRTPEGLIRTERMRQAAFELKASMGLSSLEAFRKEFDCDVTQSMSLDELEDMRKRMQNQLLEGRVGYESPRTGALAQIMKVATEIAGEIFSLDWIVLTAEGAEFVTSDRPISMVDHAPQHPWSGNGWKSSAEAISFYPISPTKGLFMVAGDHSLTVATSDRLQVRRLNLMTYGWAERFIYGKSQEVVSKVRRQARSHPKDVVKPRPPKQVLLIPPDALSPSVTSEYARRGWPSAISVAGKDGKPKEMGYIVVDFDEPAGSVAQLGTEIAQALHQQG
ncbi:MAG TPA: DUF4238 domain-containing protein [Solirubrobacterales bacterium]|jgi:hypothetical protein|nr:DUF4238 domain-containing protein [Solirubrobacterales bacterium]